MCWNSRRVPAQLTSSHQDRQWTTPDPQTEHIEICHNREHLSFPIPSHDCAMIAHWHAAGDLPVKDLFDIEGIEVFHLCIEIPNEVSIPTFENVCASY